MAGIICFLNRLEGRSILRRKEKKERLVRSYIFVAKFFVDVIADKGRVFHNLVANIQPRSMSNINSFLIRAAFRNWLWEDFGLFRELKLQEKNAILHCVKIFWGWKVYPQPPLEYFHGSDKSMLSRSFLDGLLSFQRFLFFCGHNRPHFS